MTGSPSNNKGHLTQRSIGYLAISIYRPEREVCMRGKLSDLVCICSVWWARRERREGGEGERFVKNQQKTKKKKNIRW